MTKQTITLTLSQAELIEFSRCARVPLVEGNYARVAPGTCAEAYDTVLFEGGWRLELTPTVFEEVVTNLYNKWSAENPNGNWGPEEFIELDEKIQNTKHKIFCDNVLNTKHKIKQEKMTENKKEYTLTLTADEVFEIDNCLEESWSRLDEDCEMDPEDESLNLREQWVQLEAKVSQLAGQARRNKQAEIASLEKRLASLKGE